MAYLRSHKLVCNDPECVEKGSLQYKEEAA